MATTHQMTDAAILFQEDREAVRLAGEIIARHEAEQKKLDFDGQQSYVEGERAARIKVRQRIQRAMERLAEMQDRIDAELADLEQLETDLLLAWARPNKPR